MLLSYTQVFGSNEGTFEIPWPKEFLDMMDSVKSIVEFNPVDMPVLNIKCVSTSNFYSKYYVMVLAPPALMSYFSLCALYGGSYLRGQGAKIGVLPWVLRRKMAIFNDNAWQLSFWMLLIIYPQVSKIVLQLLNCKKFDLFSEEYDEEGEIDNQFFERYLDIDLSIDCNSLEYLFHEIFLGWPTFILYPVGVPVFFFALLQQARKSVAWTKRLSFMFTTYKEAYWWFECYDLLRKLMVTGVIIFIMPGTIVQIAVGIMFHMIGVIVHMRTYAFVAETDNLLQTIALVEILLTTFLGLLIRIDSEGGTGGGETGANIFLMMLLISNVAVMFILGPLSLLLVLQDFLQANRTYRRILTSCGCKAMIYVFTTEEEVDDDDENDEDRSDDSDDEYIGHLIAKSGEDSDSDDSGSDSQGTGEKSSSSSSSEESSSSSSSSDDSLGKSSVESFGATDRAIIVKYVHGTTSLHGTNSRRSPLNSRRWPLAAHRSPLTSYLPSPTSHPPTLPPCRYLGHLYKVKLDLAAPIVLEDGQKDTDYMDPGIEALYGSRLADGSDGRKVCGWGVYCHDFRRLPVMSCCSARVSCPRAEAWPTVRDIQLPPSPNVSNPSKLHVAHSPTTTMPPSTGLQDRREGKAREGGRARAHSVTATRAGEEAGHPFAALWPARTGARRTRRARRAAQAVLRGAPGRWSGCAGRARRARHYARADAQGREAGSGPPGQ